MFKPEQRLCAARKAAGYKTAKEFSDAHDIGQATYNAHERGPERNGRGLKRPLAIKYTEFLSKHLPDISADWLLYGKGSPPERLSVGTGSSPFELAEDAVPFEGYKDGFDIEAVARALYPMHQNIFIYQCRSRVLDLSGIVPGDLLVADLNKDARENDFVIAQVYDWKKDTAETILRKFHPPYLVAHSSDAAFSKPISIEDDSIMIKAVIAGKIARFWD